MSALSHVRVLDLTQHIAGPYCSKLMSGFGAEVIKVERPRRGDMVRSSGPFFDNINDRERSIPFWWFNTGKKSITLDLKSRRGGELLMALVPHVDVVLESNRPQTARRLGLDYRRLSALNPRLVMVSVSNFGQLGPYAHFAATEIVLQALSGQMYCTGDPQREPLRAGPAVSQISAGLHAYLAALMALHARGRDGHGQYADVSIHEAGVENLELRGFRHIRSQADSSRADCLRPPSPPWGIYKCTDGYVAVLGGPIRLIGGLAVAIPELQPLIKARRAVLDRLRSGEWTESPFTAFSDGSAARHGPLDDRATASKSGATPIRGVDAIVSRWTAEKTRAEVVATGRSLGLAFARLPSLAEIVDDPQHKARGFFARVEDKVVGPQVTCGAPFQMSASPWRSAPPPRLGEHNASVFGEMLGMSQRALEQLTSEGVL